MLRKNIFIYKLPVTAISTRPFISKFQKPKLLFMQKVFPAKIKPRWEISFWIFFSLTQNTLTPHLSNLPRLELPNSFKFVTQNNACENSGKQAIMKAIFTSSVVGEAEF